MSKVLFVNGPASGHINPTLGLVRELIERGEEIVYFASEEFRERIEGLGACFRSYDNFLLHDDPFATKHFMGLVVKLLSSYDIVIPGVLEQVRGERFDYMIHDSMYGCGVPLARLLGLPHLATCTSFVRAERLAPKEGGGAPAHLMKENMHYMQAYASLSRSVSVKYGIKRPTIDEVFFNKGQINLVYTSAMLQPGSEQLDDSFTFVGYSPSVRKDDPDFPFERLAGSKVIYISLGTVFNGLREFYEACFTAFASFAGVVVVSIGNRLDVGELGRIPGNFIVKNSVPQQQLLQHADLFITHGGMGSMSEALYEAVPLLVVPLAADQSIVAERVVELGAGLRLERSELTPELLRDSAERILADGRFAASSRQAGASLRAAGGQREAARQVLAFKTALSIS